MPRPTPVPIRTVAATAAGLAALGVATAQAKSDELHSVEREAFRIVNESPESLNRVVYVLMQAGWFGAIPITSGIAWRLRRPRLAARLAAAGLAAWAMARVVKQIARRARPDGCLDGVIVRGREWTGLGFPSGHAAVAASLASAAGPDLPVPARVAAWLLVVVVAVARLYVGAHLPLDAVGGLALGIAAGNAARLAVAADPPGTGPVSPAALA